MADNSNGRNEATAGAGETTAGSSNGQSGAGDRSVVSHELEWRETRRGQHPGESYVRILQPHRRNFRRTAPGRLLATEKVLQPKGWFARLRRRIKRFLIGAPLATAELSHERLTKIKALAVLSSDAVSSSAYGTEEILFVLILAGTGALQLTLPVAAGIALLLAIVANSYRQTIKAYPQGGGTYIVAKDNLGVLPALFGASALLVDYLMTVAVSISAGVAAITSAFPDLYPSRVYLAVFFIFIITVINLRGIRESGTIFTAPTYLFIGSMLTMIAFGAYKALFVGVDIPIEHAAVASEVTEPVTIFLLLRAFAAGCSALTGTEAISDGVPAFKPPESKNAVTTLIWMASVLAVLFLGVSLLASKFGVMPNENETVVSQIARGVFGTDWFYYVIQGSTMLILVLAANTSFADFPRLSWFLARDQFLPHQFYFRGDRLAFSTGILVLGVLASLLVILFEAETHALMPLYATGVFISFTISQSGMVKRWWTRREPGWHYGIAMNGIGAVTTGVVAMVITSTKFIHGAWVVLLLVPILVLTLRAINAHYTGVSKRLALEDGKLAQQKPGPAVSLGESPVVVPVGDLNEATFRAICFARTVSKNVTAVHVADDVTAGEKLAEKWHEWVKDVPLIILESPYRSLVAPLLAYIDATAFAHPGVPTTVLLSDFVPRHWWEYLLHNHSALRLRVSLFFRPNTVVIDFPYHISRQDG